MFFLVSPLHSTWPLVSLTWNLERSCNTHSSIHTIMSMVLIGSQVDSKSHSELAEALYSTDILAPSPIALSSLKSI